DVSEEHDKKIFFFLKNLNFDPRDERIRLIEDDQRHDYEVDGQFQNDYISVSRLVSQYFPTFDEDRTIANIKKGKGYGPSNKYWDKTDLEIKEGWRKNGDEASLL